MIAAAVPHAGTLHLGAVAGLAHAAVLGARLLGRAAEEPAYALQ